MSKKYSYPDFKLRVEKIYKNNNKTAIVKICNDNKRLEYTYNEILKSAIKLKSRLISMGLKESDRIAIVSEYSCHGAICSIALGYGGFTCVLLDASLPKDELNRLIEFSDVRTIFASEKMFQNIDKDLITDIPVLKIGNKLGYEFFEGSCREAKKEQIVENDDEVIAIIYSSGTTGTMKGVEITYTSVIYGHDCLLDYGKIGRLNSYLNILPLNHIAGYSITMTCTLEGIQMGFVEDLSSAQLSEGFTRFNPESFIMIPKVFEIVMNKIKAAIDKKPLPVRVYANLALKISSALRKSTGIKLSWLTKPIWKAALGNSIKLCGCGTSPCPDEVISFYLDLGVDFTNVYGATETGFPITALDVREKYPNKGAGKISQFDFIKVIIHDADSSGTGEIRVKTPLIMKGYFRDKELSENSFDENGYFKTGDSGYVDNEGNLYVTGRIKEAIVLKTGKKVSPVDADEIYQKICGDVQVACAGITVEGKGYDEIHAFLQKNGANSSIIEQAANKLKEFSYTTKSSYKISDIHIVDELPTTSVGKVKRYMLKEMLNTEGNYTAKEETAESESKEISGGSIEEQVYSIIDKLKLNNVKVGKSSKLEDDLGFDSLCVFELYSELESEFNVNAMRLQSAETVGELISLIEGADSGKSNKNKKNNVEKYPLKRDIIVKIFYNIMLKLSNRLYDYKAFGLENVNADENYIFCPNHESHFDGAWVLGKLDKRYRNSIISVAADYLFKNVKYGLGVKVMGGIPVERDGNTAPAIKRALDLLNTGKYSLLIHPEGTRTRSGELGDFKLGAAELSIKSNIKIIPVCIDGAYDIFPPDKHMPKVFNIDKNNKPTLHIKFGTPIDPEGKTKEEITDEIRKAVVSMKEM